MNCPSLHHWLILYGKRTAAGLLFSSLLIPPVWSAPVLAAPIGQASIIQQDASNLSAAFYRNIMRAAAAYPTQSIAGVIAKDDVPGAIAKGTYSLIKVAPSAAPGGSTYYAAINGVTVTLANPGANLIEADKSVSIDLKSSNSANAELIVESGILNSSLSFEPTSRHDAMLLIGKGGSAIPGDNDLVTVIGAISGSNRPTVSASRTTRQSVIETRGMNLLIDGQVGPNQGSPVSRLNAYNGNISEKNATHGDFGILAYLIDVKSGFYVETLGKGIFTYATDLEPGSYIRSALDLEIRDMMGAARADGKGLMQAGSSIFAHQHLWLDTGISEAAGLIQADETLAGHGPKQNPTVETPLAPVNQGGSEPLSIVVTGKSDSNLYDILLGTMNLSRIDSFDDIVSGTYTWGKAENAKDSNVLANRVMKVNAFAENSYYPSSTISAHYIKAGKKLFAGEINMPETESSNSLEAGNVYIVKVTNPEAIEKSSGNLSLHGGSFHFTSDAQMNYDYKPAGGIRENRNLDTASRVDGDFTVTNNIDSSFKTLAAGGTMAVTGGKLSGNALKTNKLDFNNLSSLKIRGTVPSPLKYNLDVADSLTMLVNEEGLGTREVDTTYVGGVASVTGGSYSGQSFQADSAVFADILGANFTESLKAAQDIDIAMQEKGSSTINSIEAGQTLSVSGGGAYTGNTLTSGSNASLSNVKSFSINESANTGGNLTIDNNWESSFNKSLLIDGYAKVTGGTFKAEAITTGAKNGSGGDFTIIGGSFIFGGSAEAPAVINGKLNATGNMDSSFTNLTVKESAIISGGVLAGSSLKTESVNLDNLDNFTMSGGTLSTSGDATISESASKVDNADIGGMASLTGGSYSGGTLQAKNVEISGLDRLSLDKLSADNIKAEFAADGQGNVKAITANENLEISGGTFYASTMDTGGNAIFSMPEEKSALSVSESAKIGGSLNASGKGASNFNNLEVKGSVTVEGGSFKAAVLTSGAENGGGGDFSITDGSFELGSDSEELSVIHGSLSSSGGNNSHNFNKLSVDNAVKMDGGFLVGGALHANTGVFTNNSVAHIASLVLDGDASGLQILDNSLVIVKSVKNSQGQDIVSGSGLIILGDPEDPSNWSDVGNFTLNGEDESGLLRASSAYVRAGDISGSGHGEAADDISVYRLEAQNIDIQNANIRLLGVNENASSIENLKISGNGETRLGDVKVGGQVDIQGGTVQARKFSSGDASFDGVGLVLTGTGVNAGKINGNLNIINNESASLGDISVTGDVKVSGGSLSAGIIDVGGDASITGTNLVLNGSEEQPGQIGGSLSLGMDSGQSASLGHIIIKSSDLNITGGTVKAVRMEVGGDVKAASTELSLNTKQDKPGFIGKDLILSNNTQASLSNLTVNGHLEANGGSLEAVRLEVGNDASLDGTSLNLNGSGERENIFNKNLEIRNNQNASLGLSVINNNLSVSGGALEAKSLDVGQTASFTNVKLALNGSEARTDHMGSLSLRYNSDSVSGSGGNKAKVGWLKIDRNLEAFGGEFESSFLEVGGNASFTGAALSLNGVEGRPDIVKGDLNLAGDSNATIGHLQVTGKSGAEGGKFNAHELVSGSLAFNGVESEIESLTVNGAAVFSGGTLVANNVRTDTSTFKNGLAAELKNMILSGKSLYVGAAAQSDGSTLVRMDQLNLNGGQLNVMNGDGGNAVLALQAFSSSSSGRALINGGIAIGGNGRLLLGTRNESWLPATLADSRATLALARPMRLDNAYGIHVTGAGQPVLEGGRIKFEADSLFVIDGSDPKSHYTGEWIKTALLKNNNGAEGALSAEGAVEATVSPGAQIYIRNPQPYTVIVALGENIKTSYADQDSKSRQGNTEQGGWTGENLQYDNNGPVQVRIERLGNGYEGQFSVLPADSHVTPGGDNPPDPGEDEPSSPGGDNPQDPGGDIPSQPGSNGNPSGPGNSVQPSQSHPNANPDIHDVIINEANKDNIGTEPRHLNTNNGSGFISYTINHENPHEATRIVEGANRIINLGAVPELLLSANNAAQTAMNQRLSLEGFRFREEDIYARSISLWALPLYKSSAGWNMEAGSLDYDYHGAIGGAALGGDISFADLSRVGLAVNFGGGYSVSGGDMPETVNNMSFWGLGAYAGWYPGNFAITADLSLTSSFNKLKQDISMLNGWNELKSDVQAYVLGASMNLEYLFKTEFLDIIPHVGFKYHYLHIYNYDVNHNGSTIIEGESFDQNIWTFPTGLRLVREFELDNGWLLKPSLDLRVTPAAGDIKSKTRTRFTNTEGEIELDSKIMDYYSWGGSAALEASFGNFTLGVNYTVEAGARSLSNTVFGVLRYEF